MTLKSAASGIGSSCTYEEMSSEDAVPGGRSRGSRAGIEGKPMSRPCVGSPCVHWWQCILSCPWSMGMVGTGRKGPSCDASGCGLWPDFWLQLLSALSALGEVVSLHVCGGR